MWPSRKWVDPLNLNPADVCLQDIATSLANQCRWAGHLPAVLTVAQHSVFVSEMCRTEDALWGLLHDASEAYLKDLPRPLKQCQHFGPAYREAERRAMAVICSVFGLDVEMPTSVKSADDHVLDMERQWREEGVLRIGRWAEGAQFDPMGHTEAREAFLGRFEELTGKRH